MERAGQRVGKYTLGRIVGTGGHGRRLRGGAPHGHRVALKMLKPALGVNADVRARFLREGYAANKVKHDGVRHRDGLPVKR